MGKQYLFDSDLQVLNDIKTLYFDISLTFCRMWKNSNGPSSVKLLLLSFSFAFLVKEAYVDGFIFTRWFVKNTNRLFCKERTLTF